MPTVSRSAVVPYSASEMFSLVDNVNSYAEFLPWCKASKELFRQPEHVRATLCVAMGALQHWFTTDNSLQPDQKIEMRLVNGPFRHLQGYWRFEPVAENQCRVTLHLEFEFSSGLIGLMFGPIFHQIANRLMDAFTQRAIHVYGKR